MTKHSITLKLINDEKKKAIVLSAKACIIDNATCSGALDVCYSTDLAGCYSRATVDNCKYIDAVACTFGSFDYCNSDYQACHNGNVDTCDTDN